MRILLIFIPAFLTLPSLCHSQKDAKAEAAQLVEELASSKDTSLIPFENDAAQAWWEKNRNKELWELQAEFGDLVVDENLERLASLPAGKEHDKCLAAIKKNLEFAESIRMDKKARESEPFRPYSAK